MDTRHVAENIAPRADAVPYAPPQPSQVCGDWEAAVLYWDRSKGPMVEAPCCQKWIRVTAKALNTEVPCGCGGTIRVRPASEPRRATAVRVAVKRPAKKKAYNRRVKCAHGIFISGCARCNPNYRRPANRNCPCGKDKRFCAIHGGASLCKCGKTKQSCMVCKDPKYICCHDGVYREKRNCAQCGGSGVCIHNRRKDRCSDPGCKAKQALRRAHLASMRPNSKLPDSGVSRAQFVANGSLPPPS